MFPDPISVDYDGEKTFARVDSGKPGKGTYVYQHTDGTRLQFDVTQSKTASRRRSEIRLTKTKVAADPLTTVLKTTSASVMIVVDQPSIGFTQMELGLVGMLGSLIDTAQDDSGTVVAKLLNGEN